MSDVEFEENNRPASNDLYYSREILGAPRVPKMAQVLQKAGVAKSEKSAYILLLVILFAIVLLSVAIFLRSRPAQPISLPYDGPVAGTEMN